MASARTTPSSQQVDYHWDQQQEQEEPSRDIKSFKVQKRIKMLKVELQNKAKHPRTVTMQNVDCSGSKSFFFASSNLVIFQAVQNLLMDTSALKALKESHRLHRISLYACFRLFFFSNIFSCASST